jgi:hypothetical protein
MRWLLGFVVAAALGAGLWLVLHDPSSTESTDDLLADRAAGTDRKGPVLEGSGAAGARALSVATGRGTIEAQILRDGRPAVAQVDVRRIGGMDAADPFRSGPTGWYRSFFAVPEPERTPLVSVVSDADGRARLAGLAPGIYRVNARDDAGNEATASTALAKEGARGAVTLDLAPATLVLEARLSWSDGRPLTGTLVLTPRSDPRGVAMWLPPQGDAPRATIQPDGTARVERLRAGTYDVRVAVSDSQAVFAPQAVVPAKGTYVFVVDAGQQRVGGRAVDALNEAPVAGATVLLTCSLDDLRTQLIARAVTDDDGRFATAVPRFPAFLVVEASGYAQVTRPVAAAGTDLTLRLLRVARVSGRVTGPDGAGAAGAVVMASGSEWDRQKRAIATADRDGRYALEGVSTGDVQVIVKGGGWVSPGLGDVQSAGFNPFVQRLAAGSSITLDLPAVPAARIAGKVFDASGAAVPGATVSAQAVARASTDYYSPYGANFPGGSGDPESAAADDTGTFLLDSLTPGSTYTLTADAPSQARATAGPYVVASETTTTAELRFPVPRYVDVLLLYEGEETPVVGARVMATAQGAAGAWPPRGTQSGSALTDAEGRARTGPAGDGPLSVVVTGTMVAVRNQSQPVEDSATGPGPFAVTLRMPRGLTIQGRVLKPDGTPAVGAQVEVDSDQRGRVTDVHAGADGAFTLSGVAAGSAALRATLHMPDRARLTGRTTAEAGSTGATITLGSGDERGKRETFRIHVLDDQGQPVVGGNVRLVSGGSSNGTNIADGWATLDADVTPGSFVARGLEKGELFVEVSGARGTDGLRLPVGPGRAGPLAPDQREIEVRLPAERAITGRVVASDGARLAGVLVRARSGKDGRNERESVGEGRSDAQGAFRVGGLAEGEYVLDVAASPDFVPLAPQTASAGSSGVELRLRRGVSARVRVADYSGKSVGGSSVSLALTPKPQPAVPGAPPAAPAAPMTGWSGRGGSSGLTGTTAMDGTVLFRGLDSEATYTLNAGVPAGRDDLRVLRLERWSPADADVRLERGYVVSGSVRDAEGRPVEGARLMRKRGEHGWDGERLNPDGTFRLTGLESGPVTLRATGPGINRRGEAGTETTLQAGTENVVLVVDAGLSLTVRVANASERREGRLRITLLQWQNERWSRGDSENDRERPGQVTFRGLKPGDRYGVWIAPDNDDLYAFQADVRPGEVTVRLERGGTIRGRVTAPSDSGRVSVSASNDLGLSVNGKVDADGRYEVKGLPSGRWTISGYARMDGQAGQSGKNFQALGQADVGGALDLTLVER